MKILVVQDEAVLALLLRRLLERAGHEVRISRDGAQAWFALEEEPIPVVISDWVMPELDGPTLCRRIRSRGYGFYTYVILLTARDGRKDRVEGLRAGVDDFLVKPVDPEELLARLEIARRILEIQSRLERQNDRLRNLATADELTGLKNRREFHRVLEVGFALATRQRIPVSLILLDVDHFKRFNDNFGHPAGDETLQAVAAVLRSHTRPHDTAARYGGEEFALMLIGVGETEACGIAERIRTSVAEQPWPHRPVTVSLGVATVSPGVTTPSALVDCADQALYTAKRRGRNCVVLYDPSLPVEVTAPA